MIRPKYPCQKVFLENRKIQVLFVKKHNFSLLKMWDHSGKPGPWCLFVPWMYFIEHGSKSQVQSTKYSTSTGTSTCIYFGDVCQFLIKKSYLVSPTVYSLNIHFSQHLVTLNTYLTHSSFRYPFVRQFNPKNHFIQSGFTKMSYFGVKHGHLRSFLGQNMWF